MTEEQKKLIFDIGYGEKNMDYLFIESEIKRVFPELFEPDIKVGDWVHNGLSLFKVEKDIAYSRISFRLATYEEISEYLISCAKRRGYKVGHNLCGTIGFKRIPSYSDIANGVLPVLFHYNFSMDMLDMNGVIIYDNGVWAKIVDPKEVIIDGVTYREVMP
jgi:hypothetical protein